MILIKIKKKKLKKNFLREDERQLLRSSPPPCGRQCVCTQYMSDIMTYNMMWARGAKQGRGVATPPP